MLALRWDFALMPYSSLWRAHRREFHQFFHQRAVFKYHPIQLRECRAFLRRVLESPEDLGDHIRLFVIYSLHSTLSSSIRANHAVGSMGRPF